MFGCVDIHFDDLSEAMAALDILKRAVQKATGIELFPHKSP